MSFFSRNVALLAALGITVVVLFPATFGPFPVTHGPASALRAIAYAALLFSCLSCLIIVLRQNPLSRVQLSHIATQDTVSPPHPIFALRC